jgi:hypothetical protein
VEFLLLVSSEMFFVTTEFLAPRSGCFAVRTAQWLILVQVALLVIFFGVFGSIFSSMEEEVDTAVNCNTPVANVAWHYKVSAAFAFGFIMNILVPIAT